MSDNKFGWTAWASGHTWLLSDNFLQIYQAHIHWPVMIHDLIHSASNTYFSVSEQICTSSYGMAVRSTKSLTIVGALDIHNESYFY